MNFLSTLMNVVSCLLVMVIVHELGHSLMLVRYGYKVKGFCIGLPLPPLATIKLGDFHLSVSPYLSGGMTIPDMKSKPEKASVWFMIVIAGPLANILLLSIIYLTRGQTDFIALAHGFDLSNPRPVVTFWMWLIALNVAGACELIPFICKDGTELLKVFRGKYTTEIE